MAREKTLKAVYTFHTTTEAMKMEQCAREHGIPGRLIPVPRQISAGCGMAWAAPAEAKAKIQAEIEHRKLVERKELIEAVKEQMKKFVCQM